jgi:hypothetical protein
MQPNKLEELRKVSNPEYVMNKAKMMGLNPVHESSRKDKKYMVFDGRKKKGQERRKGGKKF